MKRRKKLWVMGTVLALVLVLTISVAMIDHKAEKIRKSGELILEVPADTVTALSWDYGEETLRFTKDGEGWHYEGDDQFPVSQKKLESMLTVFEGLSAAFRIEEVEDYSQYGLADPACTIAFTADGHDYTVKLGAFSKMDEQRYVDIGDGSVYLVFVDPMMEFDTDLRHVIANDEVTYLDAAREITFSGAENYTILREPEGGKSHRAEDVYFARVDGKLLPLDPGRTQTYVSDMTILELTDYQTYTASQEDLSRYGLDEPELTVTVTYDEELRGEPTGETKTYVLHVGRNQEAVKQALEKDDPDAEPVPAYVRVGDSELVYEIRNQDYEKLMACGYDDLRHREIFPASTEDIASMELRMDGDSYVFASEPPAKEEDPRTFTYEGAETDVAGILSALRSLHAETFTKENPTGKLELQADVTLDSGETVRLELFRKDGESCTAKVDGQVVAHLPRTQVVELMETIHSIVLNPVAATEGTEAPNP